MPQASLLAALLVACAGALEDPKYAFLSVGGRPPDASGPAPPTPSATPAASAAGATIASQPEYVACQLDKPTCQSLRLEDRMLVGGIPTAIGELTALTELCVAQRQRRRAAPALRARAIASACPRPGAGQLSAE
jgi:hypothetical protein